MLHEQGQLHRNHIPNHLQIYAEIAVALPRHADSDRDGIVLNCLPELEAQRLLSHQIYGPLEKILQEELKAVKTPCCCRLLKRHQQVDITFSGSATSRMGPEQAQALDTKTVLELTAVQAQLIDNK